MCSYDEAVERSERIAQTFNFSIDPKARVANLGVGQRQRVEILKALYRDADILILDEPTAVLTPGESQELFGILRTMTREGLSVISSRTSSTKSSRSPTASRSFVDGKMIETVPREGATQERWRDDGRPRGLAACREDAGTSPDRAAARSRTCRCSTSAQLEAVQGCVVRRAAGEIVGIAGVDGNGQSELVDALTGLRQAGGRKNSRRRQGRDRPRGRASFDAGDGHIPEDRQRRGLVLDFTLAENIALHDYRNPPESKFGWLFPRRLTARARTLLKEFDVRGGAPQTRGQRPLGRQPAEGRDRPRGRTRPEVLVAAQPTRGLDVGAIEFVHNRLVVERDEGKAVLLVSLELDEILSLSDRILVIYEGRIVGEFAPDVSAEELGIAMTGGAQEAA